MDGFLAWAAAFVAGVAAVRVLRLGTRDVFALPVLRRRNHRGRDVPTAAGTLLVLAVLVVEAGRAAVDVAGLDERPGVTEARTLVLLACFGFGLLGLVDDLLGGPEDRGFRGHLRAAARGRLTTGSLKLLGGGALAFVLCAAATPDGGWQVLGDALLVALAANLANLFDRAPGRTLKVSLVAWVPLAVLAAADPVGLALAPVVGAAVGLLGDDLRERLMLGDTGANVLGAVLGLGVVLEVGAGPRLAVLAVLVGLNLAAEAASFSRVIEGNGVLRRLDLLGRRS